MRASETKTALYLAGGAALVWFFFFRPKTETASLAPKAVTALPSSVPVVPQLIAGNPNNLLSVATPEEESEMMGGGGAEF